MKMEKHEVYDRMVYYFHMRDTPEKLQIYSIHYVTLQCVRKSVSVFKILQYTLPVWRLQHFMPNNNCYQLITPSNIDNKKVLHSTPELCSHPAYLTTPQEKDLCLEQLFFSVFISVYLVPLHYSSGASVSVQQVAVGTHTDMQQGCVSQGTQCCSLWLAGWLC